MPSGIPGRLFLCMHEPSGCCIGDVKLQSIMAVSAKTVKEFAGIGPKRRSMPCQVHLFSAQDPSRFSDTDFRTPKVLIYKNSRFTLPDSMVECILDVSRPSASARSFAPCILIASHLPLPHPGLPQHIGCQYPALPLLNAAGKCHRTFDSFVRPSCSFGVLT